MCMRKIVASLSMLLGGDVVIAPNISPEYSFVVASGFLCDSGSCPAAVRSANGDTYELIGAGTFNTQSKSASAAGTFTHKSPQWNCPRERHLDLESTR
jgi:hypothetical protein